MQKQGGNFLLQALLALTLVFAFMPFLVKRLANRDMASQMYSAKQTIDTVYNAARLFLYDNKDTLPDQNLFEGAVLVNTLSPYGLPLGFNPVTSLDQRISFSITRKDPEQRPCTPVVDEEGKITEECHEELVEFLEPVVSAELTITPNDGSSVTEYQIAELARMIGFFARPNNKVITINVPVDVMYTDVVLRREPDINVGFLTELDMGGDPNGLGDVVPHNIEGISKLYAQDGNFTNSRFKVTQNLYVDSVKDNDIGELDAYKFSFFPDSADFSPARDAALSINGGDIFWVTEGATIGCVGVYGPNNPNLNVINVGSNTDDISSFATDSLSTNPDASDAQNCLDNAQSSFVASSSFGIDEEDGDGFSTKMLSVANLYLTHKDLKSVRVDNDHGIMIFSEVYAPKIKLTNKTMAEAYDAPNADAAVFFDLAHTSRLPDINIVELNKSTGENIFREPQKLTSLQGGDLLSCVQALEQIDYNCANKLTSNKYCEYNKEEHEVYGAPPTVTQWGTSLKKALLCKYLLLERIERRINHKLCVMGFECPGLDF